MEGDTSGAVMVGIAAATAGLYARYNIPSIPLGDDKRPLVGGFKIARLNMSQTSAYMRRNPNAGALGVPDGPLSGLVRLDIDEHGGDIVREVIRRAGDTPFKVQTASGKIHLVYASNNERRLTGNAGTAAARPWSDLKVDLCGAGGYSVSPPSRCNGGVYRLLGDVTLDQMLNHRGCLPVIKALVPRAYVQSARVLISAGADDDLRLVQEGNRDVVFYPVVARITQQVHLSGGTKAEALAEALARNSEFPTPLAECAVKNKVDSWWTKTEAGENRFGLGARKGARRMQVLAGDPPLMALIGWLKEENRPKSLFLVADGLVELLNAGRADGGWWSELKLREARRRAVADGWIVMVRKPFKGCAAGYRWGPTAKQQLFS